MQAVVAILIALALIGGILIWIGMPYLNESEVTNNTEISPEESNFLSYETRMASNFSLAFSHPTTTTVDRVNEDLVSLKYLGPKTMPNTEITDGYFITIKFANEENIEPYVQNEAGESRLQNLRFNNEDAFTYTVESALGTEVTHIVYGLQDDWLIDLGYTVAGDNSALYEQEVLDILRTIKVTPLE